MFLRASDDINHDAAAVALWIGAVEFKEGNLIRGKFIVAGDKSGPAFILSLLREQLNKRKHGGFEHRPIPPGFRVMGVILQNSGTG